MAKPKALKSLAEQIADLDDPAPQDIDPEEDHQFLDSSGSLQSAGDDEDTSRARDHYFDVEKSTLRRQNEADLGPQYSGAHVSRDDLLTDESDDDPFGSGASQGDGPVESEIDDPEDIEIGGQLEDDEDIDSGDAFEDGDEEKFKNFKFRGSKARGDDADMIGRENGPERLAPDRGDEDRSLELEKFKSFSEDDDPSIASGVPSEDDLLESGDTSNEGSEDESQESSPDVHKARADDRAAIRKMMVEEQKTVAATLSQAVKADADKGAAVKHQRTVFGQLLNTRIRLQKALIATNSLSAVSEPTHPSPLTTPDAYDDAVHAAETAALALFNNLSSLRASLSSANPKKRPFSALASTSSPELSTYLSTQEAASLPARHTTLDKWSQRLQPPSNTKLHSLTNQPHHQPLTTVLTTHLSTPNLSRLLHRAHTPRSCAPLQAARAAHPPTTTTLPTDPTIYDDADFYTQLLRELIDQRMEADSANPGAAAAAHTLDHASDGNNFLTGSAARRAAKTRKLVDTKASKGRKMRYTVHEKLVNFMVRREAPVGGWEDGKREELVGGLLGVRPGKEAGQGDGMEVDEEDGEDDVGTEWMETFYRGEGTMY